MIAGNSWVSCLLTLVNLRGGRLLWNPEEPLSQRKGGDLPKQRGWRRKYATHKWLWYPASKRAPLKPHAFVQSLHVDQRWSLRSEEYSKTKGDFSLPSHGHKSHWNFFTGLLDYLLWNNPAPCWGHSSSPVQSPTWRGTWALLPSTVSTDLPATRLNHHGNRPSRSSPGFRRPSPQFTSDCYLIRGPKPEPAEPNCSKFLIHVNGQQ